MAWCPNERIQISLPHPNMTFVATCRTGSGHLVHARRVCREGGAAGGAELVGSRLHGV